ncbi:MAG: hypothetical protein H7249_00275 [Chitinophagaceae bacterium]|nr:hypothetical protein [Oligoflexus sp.]
MDEKVPAAEIAKRSWSEGIWMYLFQDSALQRGKKSVLTVLAPDRTNPSFDTMSKAFKAVEEELDKVHDLRVFFEDHPGGFLHEKFGLPAQKFAWYLIDIHGDRIAESSEPITVADVLGKLKNVSNEPRPEQLS